MGMMVKIEKVMVKKAPKVTAKVFFRRQQATVWIHDEDPSKYETPAQGDVVANGDEGLTDMEELTANNAIYILFTYFASFIGCEDDFLEVAQFGRKKDKFDGESFKKLNTAEFMEYEFVFFQVCPIDWSEQAWQKVNLVNTGLHGKKTLGNQGCSKFEHVRYNQILNPKL